MEKTEILAPIKKAFLSETTLILQAFEKRTKIKTMPYRLEIQIPENDHQDVIIKDSLTIGSDPSNDICLQEYGLAPKHCLFREQQGVLTLMNIGGSKPFKIGKQKLELGKTYILDHKDRIQFGDLVILVDEFDPTNEEVVLEEIEPKNILGTPIGDLADDPDADEEMEEEETDPSHAPAEPTSLSVDEIISRAREASGEHVLADIRKTGKKKSKESTHWDELSVGETTENRNEKTSSKLFQLTQKLKKILINRPKREQAVKVEPIKKIVTTNPKVKIGKLENIPGFIPRFFALCFNLTLTGLIVQMIFDIPSAEAGFIELQERAKAFLLTIPELGLFTETFNSADPEVLASILVYFVLEYFFSFLFGRSLGYTLMGIYENSGFISTRMKALLRTTLALLTFPFLIFDIPAFFRRRTLKEVLSFSSFGFHQSFLSYLTALLLLPAFLLVFLLADAFNKKDLPLAWEYQEVPAASEEVKRTSLKFLGFQLAWDEEWTSNTLPSLTPGRLLSLQQNESNLAKPKLGVAVGLSEGLISFYPGRIYSAQAWFRLFNSRNIPVRFINPQWHEFVELSEAPGPVSPEMKDQMRMLFLASFTDYLADPLNLLQYVQIFGPLLPPIETWRDHFMQNLMLNQNDNLRWVRNGGRDLLVRQIELEQEFVIEHIYLDQTPFRSLVLTGPLEQKELVREISHKYFHPARPIRRGPVAIEELTNPPFVLLDYLAQWLEHIQENKLPLPLDSMDKIDQGFFDLAGETLGLAPEDPIRQQFGVEFSRLIKFLDNAELLAEGQELRGRLKLILKAYQEQRSSFFIRDSYNQLDKTE